VTRKIRARRVEGSWPPRPPQPHPDAARTTRRLPFEQLRALVISLIEPEPDDPVGELDGQATTYRGPRTRTLDPRIAFLRKQ
jgi:hypothetical protein